MNKGNDDLSVTKEQIHNLHVLFDDTCKSLEHDLTNKFG